MTKYAPDDYTEIELPGLYRTVTADPMEGKVVIRVMRGGHVYFRFKATTGKNYTMGTRLRQSVAPTGAYPRLSEPPYGGVEVSNDLIKRLNTWADSVDREASEPDFPGGSLGFWREVEDVLREAAAALAETTPAKE